MNSQLEAIGHYCLHHLTTQGKQLLPLRLEFFQRPPHLPSRPEEKLHLPLRRTWQAQATHTAGHGVKPVTPHTPPIKFYGRQLQDELSQQTPRSRYTTWFHSLELPPMSHLADPQISTAIFPLPSNRTCRNLSTVPVDSERAPPNVPAAVRGSGSGAWFTPGLPGPQASWWTLLAFNIIRQTDVHMSTVSLF